METAKDEAMLPEAMGPGTPAVRRVSCRGVLRCGVLRRVLLRVLSVAVPLAGLSHTADTPAQQYPNQNCVATMENRSVPVADDGTYVIPNVPVNPGQYRARVICQQPDGTVLGSTTPYTVLTPNGSTVLPSMQLSALTAQPDHLKLLVINGALTSLGATVQLETQAIDPEDFGSDYTPVTLGTTYSSSNNAVATVNANGLVTATGPGTVVITARNDGLASTIFLTSFGLLDSDGDGMPDAYELANGLNPYDPTDAAQDPDGDGLTNLQEFQLGTNPHAADTDGDGLNDGDEVRLGTNPLVADTDGDGLSDGDEVRLGTNPLNPDTDGDGIPDGIEVKIGTNPLVADVTTTVVGHVSNANGTPYVGASVVTITYFTAVTDSTGAFTMYQVPVTLGNILVSARAVVGTTVYNGASASTPAIGNGTTDVGTITLGQSAGQVSGVVSSPDNKPVAGAQVTVVDGTDTRTAITDGSGIYLVTGLQPGAVSVAAFDPATSLRGQNGGTLTAGGPLTLNVSLAAFGTVSGTVRDASGAPVGAGIPVTITGVLNATATTDTLGHYSFNFVSLGGFQVDATDSNGNHGRASGTITATAQTIKADVQYLGRGTVSGKVTDGQGNAVAGASITLINNGLFRQQLSATTDSVGNYSIPNVFVGSISVAATAATSNTGGSGSGTITANGQSLVINISLQPTASVSGTVFRKDGTTPVSGAVVSLNNSGFTTTANSAGQYSIANVPLGTYTVNASDPSSTDRGSATAALTTAGASVAANIVMVGTGSVVVTVHDGTGAIVSGASVRVDGNGPYYQSQTGVTGSDGTTTFTQQLAGPVTVSATNPATGLSGNTNAAVTAGSSVAVTVNLQPYGTVTGKVFKHDATTPVAGAIVQIDGGTQVLTGGDGSYTFSTVASGNHSVSVLDSTGNLLAFNNNVVITTQGQTATANFVIIARGTVTGHVTYPDGSAASGIPVQVTSSVGGDNNPYGTQTDVSGSYTVAQVPVGGYTVVAQQHSQTTNLYGTATGVIASDGATTTTNVQLSSSLVPSTTSLTDANGFPYPIRENAGLFDGAFSVFAGDSAGHEGGSLLSLTLNGTTTAFTGATFSTSSLSARQLSIQQTGLDGLNVTRRVYVPIDGYFARYVELLTNPTSQDITVGVQLNSYYRRAAEYFQQSGVTALNGDVPHILLTSSGDTILNVNDPNTPDNWVTLGGPGDRDPFMPDQFADSPVPAIADVFSGPGAALKPSAATYTVDAGGLFSTLAENFSSVRVPAGGTVGILHFVSQENAYSAANATAQRLVQLPPEALAGLSSTDISAITNFAIPSGGTSSVPALPSLTNQVTGFVYASNGTTTIPGAQVRLQSTDTIFDRTYIANTDSNGTYSFQGAVGGFAIPAENYSVYALHPTTSSPLTAACAQNGHYTGNGCSVDSPVFNGSFASGATQSATDINFSNTGIISGTVSRGPTVLNVSGTVSFAGSAMSPVTLPINADGTFILTGVLPGSYTITAQVTNTLLQGITSATVIAGQTTTANITIGESGSLQGTVTRPDNSLAVNDVVNLRATGVSLQAVVDTSGHYAFTDIPIGAYTVDVYDSLSNAAATASVVVTNNATTTQNLLLQSAGNVNGTVTVNDGSSVSGLTVTLTSTTSNGTQSLSTVTDGNGKYSFTNVKPGTITLRTTTPAGLQGAATGSLPLAGQTVTINISLTSAGNVTGTVFQGDGTTRAAGIQVTISPAPLTGSATTTTDLNGSYNFSNQPFGSFTVYAVNTANNDRGQSSSQIQTNGQLRTVNINLTGFGTLVVNVVNSSGTRIANASVTLSPSQGSALYGTTNSNGSVTFSNVFVGSFSVTAHDPVSNLSAFSNGTLAYNATQTVTMTLQAVGSAKGFVYAPDGTTPVAGATVQLNAPYGPGTTTAADGSFQFTNLSVGGSYSFQARDTAGHVRANAPYQYLQTSGQVLTQNLTFVGVGTVTGTVTNPDGSRATNATLTVLSKNSNVGGSWNFSTGGDGTYSAPEVPVGAFTVTVTGLPSTLAGFTSGTITGDGDHETADIQIQSSTVSLPVTLTDADGFTFPITTNGQFYSTGQSFGFYPFYSAQLLQITVNGSTSTFGDNSSPTTALQSLGGQQIEINQPSLAGLSVTRKIYVPTDGYFARRMETLQNNTSSPITAIVSINGNDRYSTLGPQVITTSNNNTTVNNTILWAVDDDDNGTRPYPQTQPAHANVFAGAGAPTGMQTVTRSTYYYPGYYNNPSYTSQTWNYTYKSVTIPANSKVSFLFFTAQEASASTATTAAQRLVQLPAEALAGISSADLATVVNFVVPTTPLAASHPPATMASLAGTVLTGDSTTPIPNASVYAQSTDLLYGGGAGATANSTGGYATPAFTASGYAVEALDPSTGVMSETLTGNFTAAVTTQGQDIPFTNTGILTGSVQATGQGAVGTGTVYVSLNCPNGSGGYSYCGSANQTLAPDHTFKFLTILSGNQNIAANLYTPQGGYIYLPQGGSYFGVNVVAMQTTNFTFQLPAVGTIAGTLTNADGTPAGNTTVSVYPSNYNKGISASTTTAADGTYSIANLPLDTYTVYATDPSTGGQVSKTATITQDTTSVVNLQFIGKGTVVATVHYANGNIGQNVGLYISTSTASAFKYAGTSDNNGQYTFNNVPSGAFTIRAFYPNQNFYSTTTGTITGNNITQQLAVTLTPVGTVSGTVLFANNTPANGQGVTITDGINIYNGYAGTDSAGAYAFFPVPADRPLGVSTTYYNSTLGKNVTATAKNQQVPGDGQTLTVNLRYPGAASVKVTVLKTDSTPYTSGSVYLKSNDGTQSYGANITANGTVTFNNVLEGTLVAYASVDYNGFAAGSKVFTIAPPDDGTTVNVTINTSPKGTVQGQVYASDGTTVVRDNYNVTITDVDASVNNYTYPNSGTGYSFTNVQVGASGFQLVAKLNTLDEGKQTFAGNITSDGQVLTHDFTLPVSSVSGTVFLHDGVTPVPNTSVYITETGKDGSNVQYSSSTDASGTYEIAGPTAGQLKISASDDNGVSNFTMVNLATDTSIVTAANISLVATGTVLGTVYDTNGHIIPNQYVDIESTGNNGGFSTSAYTDSNGYYLATDIPVGDITVSYYDNNTSQTVRGTGTLVNDGDSITINLGNVPSVYGGRVFGTVYDTDGNPAPQAVVTITPADTTVQPQTVTADDNGMYSAQDLPLGDVTVSAVLSDGTTQVPPVTGNIPDYQTPVEIDLGLTDIGNVSGVVSDADGNPMDGVDIGLSDSNDHVYTYGTGTNSDGFFFIGGLVPGVITVQVRDHNTQDLLTTATGVLPYGGNLTLNITVPAAGNARKQKAEAKKSAPVATHAKLILPRGTSVEAGAGSGEPGSPLLQRVSLLHVPPVWQAAMFGGQR